jgi:hypothetical protein
MKKLLIFIFVISSLLSFSQTGFFKNDYKGSINTSNQFIDLKLPTKKFHSVEDTRTGGIALIIAGIAFTTASILEGNGNYGTWKSSPNSTSKYNQTYTTKPFMQQTPRQIMLFVGIGLTISGGIIRFN